MVDIVIYHSNCYDGTASAWVAKTKFPDARYLPWKYFTDPPDVSDKNVLILDFSFKKQILLDMKSKAKSIVVIDHHKSAKEDLEGIANCIFDMDKCGAELTWRYLYDTPQPWFIDIIADNDLWRNKFKAEFRALENNKLLSFEGFNKLLSINDVDSYRRSLYDIGLKLLTNDNLTINKMVSGAHIMILSVLDKKYKLGVIVNNGSYMNEVCHILAQKYGIGAVMFVSKNTIKFSLRSESIDVGNIASAFGGGGHKCASGFNVRRSDLKKYIKIIK